MAQVTIAIELDDLGCDTIGENRDAANEFFASFGLLLAKNVDRIETDDGYMYGTIHDLSEEAVAAVEIIVSHTTFFEIKSVQ
jgi:hypothetical protein